MLEKFVLKFQRWLIRVVIRMKWRGKAPQDLTVSNESMPVEGDRIALRVYTPKGTGPFPVLHFFHGGGWIGFDLDTHDCLCRDLCVRSGFLVVAFDYRLAPENPFPVPVQDCLATLDWIKANSARLGGDIDRLVICGDSAGGNLATVSALQARSRQPGLIKGQVLIYPVTDHCDSGEWPSYTIHGGRGAPLTHKKLSQLWSLYLRNSPSWPEGTRSHDLATPLHVRDLSGMPRTLLVIADDDLLRDEGLEYGQRLARAGCSVEVKRYAGQHHGFVGLEPTPAHRQAVADIAAWLKAGA